MAGMTIDLNKLKNIKLTKEQQQYVALAVVGVVGAVYGYWTFLLKPLAVEQEFWTKSVTERIENLRKAKEFKDNWAKFEMRLARVQTGEQYVSRRILPAAGADQLMLRISKLALESGVGLTSYRPEALLNAETAGDGIYKNRGQLEITCTFHQLGAFFSKLSGEDVIYNVDELEVTPTELNAAGTGMNLRGNLKFVSYSIPPGGSK